MRQSTSIQNHTFDHHPNTMTQTVLGEELNNPFAVNNLRNALDSLCDDPRSSRIQIKTTDLQIKFNPRNYDEVKKLIRDTSLILFDYPLNREVITMGDYYIDPQTQDNIPAFYSFAKVGQQLPQGIQYEVIEEYDYEIDNPLLLAESFRLTDNFEYVNDYIFPEDIENEVEICGKIIDPPGDLDCPPPCVPVLVIDDSQVNPNGGVVYKWDCDCSGSGGGTGGGGTVLNSCGCPDDGEIRTPGGCITVENTKIPGPEGVRDVKVIIRDYKFGKPYTTSTDKYGCWQYTSKRFKGNLWMWVEFKNDNSFERCYAPGWEMIFGAVGVIVEYLKPVKHYIGSISGPNFSDIEVHYPPWTKVGSKEQILWGAATVNNEVQVFNEMAIDINVLPNLDIYLIPNSGSGVTLMSHYSGYPPILGLTGNVLTPDISLGLDVFDRDVQDALSYHEMAHASHFTQVGQLWWYNLFTAEAAHSVFSFLTFNFEGDPYGNGNGILDGYIAVAESWAENIGFEFAGWNKERLLFENGYIPEGLYNDLEDVNTDIWDISHGIRDNVSGFTRSQMFDVLTNDVTNIEEFRDRLQPLLPSGTTLLDYNNLFDDYLQ